MIDAGCAIVRFNEHHSKIKIRQEWLNADRGGVAIGSTADGLSGWPPSFARDGIAIARAASR